MYAFKALIASQSRAMRGSKARTRRINGSETSRHIARQREVKRDRRPESARMPGRIRRRRDGVVRQRAVFRPKPHGPYRRADDAPQGRRATEGLRCARSERRERHVQRREMPGNKADGAEMAVQPRRTRTRWQSRDCGAVRGLGGCTASFAAKRRPAFSADSLTTPHMGCRQAKRLQLQ